MLDNICTFNVKRKKLILFGFLKCIVLHNTVNNSVSFFSVEVKKLKEEMIEEGNVY